MSKLGPLVLAAVLLAACSSDGPRPSASASSSESASATATTLAASSSAPPATPADWVAWGHDASRAGASSDGPSATGLRSAWTSPAVDGDVYAQPLVVGDVVYVEDVEGRIGAYRLGGAR